MAGVIVVDGVFFQQDVFTGVARLWREILAQWAQSDIGKRMVLLDRGQLPEGLEGIATHPCPPLDQARWEDDRAVVQGICDALGAALFISTYYTHPLSTPSLLWIHDMIPERLEIAGDEPVWRQKRAAIQYARGYACSSAHSLADLHGLFPETAAKPSVVAGCGVSAAMRPANAVEIAGFRERLIAPKLEGRRYIFLPGHTHAYKNGALLAGALERMDCTGLALLLTVDTPELERFRAVPDLVVHCERLSEADLRLAYAGAHCLVYPSFYEGFGLPVLEAMACGCPVICSNRSSLPEVAGDAAILIDPAQGDQVLATLARMDRPGVRADLIAKGLARAREFSWIDVALQLEVLVAQALGERGWWEEDAS